MKLPGFKRSPARTTLLGVAALGVMLWAAVTQLGVGVNSLLAQFIVLLMALLLVMGLAAAGVLLLAWWRRRRG